MPWGLCALGATGGARLPAAFLPRGLLAAGKEKLAPGTADSSRGPARSSRRSGPLAAPAESAARSGLALCVFAFHPESLGPFGHSCARRGPCVPGRPRRRPRAGPRLQWVGTECAWAAPQRAVGDTGQRIGEPIFSRICREQRRSPAAEPQRPSTRGPENGGPPRRGGRGRGAEGRRGPAPQVGRAGALPARCLPAPRPQPGSCAAASTPPPPPLSSSASSCAAAASSSSSAPAPRRREPAPSPGGAAMLPPRRR